MYRLIVVELRAIFVFDIVYTSCNFDLIHYYFRIISISSNKTSRLIVKSYRSRDNIIFYAFCPLCIFFLSMCKAYIFA